MSTATPIPKHQVTPLHPQLQSKLASLRAKKNFNPGAWVETRTDQFLVYMQQCRLKSAIVSVSGGVDSSTIAALLKHAQDKASLIPDHPFNPSNGGRIVAIAQPFHSTIEIQNRAYEVCTALQVPSITINRTEEYDASMEKVETAIGESLDGFAKAMCKSYERTPINYLLASHYKGVVVGTGNKDEDGYLFYYCKFGDGAVDVGLIWDLHKSEVYRVAAYLKVPESVLVAPPSADLSPGQFDEDEIGATYDAVEYITTYLTLPPAERIAEVADLCPEALEQFHRETMLIQSIHNRGLHKADLNPKNIGSQWYFNNIASSPTVVAPTAVISAAGSVSITLAEAQAIIQFLTWDADRQGRFLVTIEGEERNCFDKQLELVRTIRS